MINNIVILLSAAILASCSVKTDNQPAKDNSQWTNLLDKNLSQWDMYLGYRLKNGYNGQQPVDEKGTPIEPIGYNKNEANVFSVEMVNGEPVLHITGEIYGCVFTKQEFSNYHFTLKYKWGERKWEPRLDKLKDSGILYHSIGECGVDYWRAWMRSQEFQVMEGHAGDYWSGNNTAIDIRAYLPEGDIMNSVADTSQSFLSMGAGTGRMGFCLRSANFESAENEWTTLDLICFEGKSIHMVNGHVVMVLKNSRYMQDSTSIPLISGKIQLQSEAGEVYYKDIRIKRIDKMPEEFASLFIE
ncbi:MAG TPA: DUF1080 domain-containing protein [Bacteroidales bacterium]|nr:DUF1080 domain-containing protein [Bacteroidales bacterium]